jgi:hypothetical protein
MRGTSSINYLPPMSNPLKGREKTQKTHTTILVGNDLGLVVDSESNGAVGVAKGDTDGDSVTGLDAGLDAVALRHLGEKGGGLIEIRRKKRK